MRTRALGVGPANHHELLTVQALDLAPEAAIAGHVGAVEPLRNNALDPELAGMTVEGLAAHKMVLAVLQPGWCAREQRFEAFLSDPQRLACQVLTVKEDEIEQHEDETLGVAHV